MEQEFIFKKTFRYEILNADSSPKKVLYVLHGYGQLAKYFIRKFNSVASDYLIVAPEGMHRFYRRGSSGRVGASWMTKEARDIDISDNMDWLNALDEEITSKHEITERILLGFSQGGATAIRWKLNARLNFNKTIIWASVFPPDMENHIEKIKGEESNYFVIGDQDEFFNLASQARLTEYYDAADFNSITYSGGHDIDAEVLERLLSN